MSQVKKTIFPQIEHKILQKWKEQNSFQESINQRQTLSEGGSEYIFYDGPPFANGLPHYGHLLTGFIKDTFARYQTMLGKRVERRFGWDCHGLPVEMEVEKELTTHGRNAIKEHGIDKFNDTCKKSVMKYTSEWEKYVTRQGRWVDFKNDYKTMDLNYMESVIWAFKELFKKGLIYEAFKVMPYSWKCQTPVSNFETRMDNAYRQKESKSVFVKFKLKQTPEFIKNSFPNAKNIFLIAWTTTPWTLPSNLALMIKSDIQYTAKEQKNGDIFIFASSAEERIKKYLS